MKSKPDCKGEVSKFCSVSLAIK